jgi:hypothetical protein
MKIFAFVFALFLAACGQRESSPPSDWKTWAVWVEARYPVSDAEGHGPDVGSDEWAQALQQKLGLVDNQGHGPDLGSAEWRAAVERKMQGSAGN